MPNVPSPGLGNSVLKVPTVAALPEGIPSETEKHPPLTATRQLRPRQPKWILVLHDPPTAGATPNRRRPGPGLWPSRREFSSTTGGCCSRDKRPSSTRRTPRPTRARRRRCTVASRHLPTRLTHHRHTPASVYRPVWRQRVREVGAASPGHQQTWITGFQPASQSTTRRFRDTSAGDKHSITRRYVFWLKLLDFSMS